MRNNINIISNQQISIKFNINIVDPSGALGTLVYSENHNTQTNNNGLVNLAIGLGTPDPNNAVSFNNIDWGGNNYFLTTMVDFTGGTNYTTIGSQKLKSVPYSLYSKEAESIAGGLPDISTNGSPGNITIDNGSTIILNVDDADADANNELNTSLQLNGDTLQLTDNGGTISVDLSTLNSGTDDQNIQGSSFDQSTGTLTIGIENGASETVDLSGLQPTVVVDGMDANSSKWSLLGVNTATSNGEFSVGPNAISNYSQVTNLYMNNIDIPGGDATNWILDAKVGDHFILRNSQDYADFAIYEVSSSAPVSSAFGYDWTLLFLSQGNSNTFTIGNEYLLSYAPSGIQGIQGLSAYDVWINQGNTGTQQDFLDSLVGATGAVGPQGNTGPQGASGISAYDVWINQGNTGTQQDFLDSLVGATGATGAQGIQGLSAYEVWIAQGNTGTVQDYLDSLVGAQGVQGTSIDSTVSITNPNSIPFSNMFPNHLVLYYSNGIVDTLFDALPPGPSGPQGVTDTDWYIENTTSLSTNINDNIFTNGNVGIGTNPSKTFHVKSFHNQSRFESMSDGSNGLNNLFDGIEIGSKEMNPNSGNTYSAGIKFMSFDSNILNGTEPKFVAAIAPRATEPYILSNHGGMALDFATTINDPGTGSTPIVRMTIDEDGQIGMGSSTSIPDADLHIRQIDTKIPKLFVTGTTDGSGMVYVGKSITYGGGIGYDGDGIPTMVGDNDRFTLFRRDAGVDFPVMSWPYNSGLVRINDLGGTGTRMVVADAIGNLSTQTINTGDITSVVAGNGLTGGGLTQDVTLNIGGGSGITVDVDDISVNVSDFMTNGANTRVLTAAGLDDMHANSWLTYNGSRLFIMPAGGSGDGQLLVRGLLNNNPSNTDALMRVEGNGTTMTVGVNNDSTVWLQTWPLSSTGTQVASKMSLNPLGQDVGVGTVTPEYQLDVNGDARIGYHGNNEKMYIKFSDFRGSGAPNLYSGEKWGEQSGADCGGQFDIPNGYQVTGIVLYFDDLPDDIIINEGSFLNASSTTLVEQITAPSTQTLNIDFLNPVTGNDKYIFMEIINNGSNSFSLGGGYFKISPN